MTDPDALATDLLDHLAAGLPDTAPPPSLVASGRALRRRRRRTAVGASLAAVVVALAGIAVLPQVLGSTGPEPAAPAEATMAAPPPGTRWVGQNGVVVAVPEHWGTQDFGCYGAYADTVFRVPPTLLTDDSMYSTFCIAPRAAGASYVQIETDVYSAVAGAGPIACFHLDPGYCTGSVSAPDSGVQFLVRTNGPDAKPELDAIIDSLTVVPDGWTTVPWPTSHARTNVEKVLDDAGLAASADGELEGRSPATTVPALGSPVPVGSTVSVVPWETMPLVVDPVIARAGQLLDLSFPTGASRSLSFLMDDGRGSVFGLAAARGRERPRWVEGGPIGVDALGVSGPGPDTVLVPPVASAGLYEICAREDVCGYVTVIE